MRGNRDVSFEWMLAEEGPGFRSDRPTGGRAWGLLRSDWVSFIGCCPQETMEVLTRDDALKAYNRIWEQFSLDHVPAGLDYFLFDSCVVCTRPVVLRWINHSMLGVDNGAIGPSAVELVRDLEPSRAALLVSQLSFSRRRRHKTEPGWYKWSQQWTNRVNRVQHRALKLIGMPA